MAASLRFETVGARFAGAAEILSDLDLVLAPGEVAIVSGERGSGKSLLAALAALRRAADRGRVEVLGRAADRLASAEAERLRRRVGFLPAAPMLVSGLDAAENVAIPLRLAGVPEGEARANAAELLHWLWGDAITLSPRAGPGSPAWRRIALARALVHRPALAILDEPLRDLDTRGAARVRTLIETLAEGGSAFLITGASGEPAAVDWPGVRRLRLAAGRLDGHALPIGLDEAIGA